MANEFKVKHGIKFPDNTIQTTAATGGGGSLSTLSDVSISNLTQNQILSYNGTAWVNVTNTGGSGITTGKAIAMAMVFGG